MPFRKRLSRSPPFKACPNANSSSDSDSTPVSSETDLGMSANEGGPTDPSRHLLPSQPNDKLDDAIQQISRELDLAKKTAERLRKLRDFEIVIVCDDFGTMLTPVDDKQRTRWDELCEIVKKVLKIGVMFDSNGVDIHFLNRDGLNNVKDPRTVDQIFQTSPSGYTPLTPVLNKIFQSKLADPRRDKKLLVLVATDGVPTDDDGNEDIDGLERTMRETRRIDTTYVSFLLCTDDQKCVDYLSKWDRDMPNVDVTDDFYTERDKIRKCLKQENYPFSHGDYVVKALIGAIDPEIDALNESNLLMSEQ